jgi:hypothetical protein
MSSKAPQAHLAEASAEPLGTKRIMRANPSGSALTKKRKLIDLTKVESEDDEEDKFAAAAVRDAFAGNIFFYLHVRLETHSFL